MARLSLEHIVRRFDSATAVDDVTIDIASGEFFSILGPSGCGKTTLLRIIAGFENPSSGKIVLDGRNVTTLAPQSRGIGMVFQNYALFPHMTAKKNIAYGLETQGLPKQDIAVRVDRILRTVGLAGLADRPVPLLSGGEQQRVAVARAIVVEPSVLLLDEPLSNLDVALRVQTREEIRSIQKTTGITTVYVTHDQAEAMSLSSRIAVMKQGHIEQVGTPAEVYGKPSTPFVAQFLGGANLLHGILDRAGRTFTTGRISFALHDLPPEPYEGQVTIAVKPEAVVVAEGGEPHVSADIVGMEYLGFITTITLSIAGTILHATVVSSTRSQSLQVGARVDLSIDWIRCTVYPYRA